MEYMQEPARQIPVVHETDLVVVGGSCTGVFAAVRAARLGARVALIERHNCFGGMATAGAVNIWHSLSDTENRAPIIGGLTREMLDRLARRDAAEEGRFESSAYRLNTEELKIELDELVVEHRIVPYLNTRYAAPLFKDGRLVAIAIENKSGRQAVRGRQFVDASGDGDLAGHLGLPAHAPERMQPPTTCAKILGLTRLDYREWTGLVSQHGAEFGLEKDWGWGSRIPGLPDIQLRADTHVFHTDAADADQLTRAEIEGRRQVRAILDILRKYGPADAPLALVDLAAALGVRETRRFRARYTLTGDDVLSGRRFDDAIANGSYRVDIHHADGPGITFRYLDGREHVVPERGKSAIEGRWRPPQSDDPVFYQIPWRCLVQDRVPNLALAGRMLDADSVAFSAARVMVNTNQTGEAAGTACALALRDGCDVACVDSQLLRETMAQGGSILV